MTYFRHLEVYDYSVWLWFFLVSFLLFFLAIFLIKRSFLSSFLVFLLMLVFIVSMPFILKSQCNTFLRPLAVEIVSSQKFHYSPILTVQTTVRNLSQKTFTMCLIQADINPSDTSKTVLPFLHSLKPIVNQSILVQKPFAKGETLEYEIVFDPFTYQGDVVVYVTTECY